MQAVIDSDVLELDPERLTRHAAQDARLAMALLGEVSARLRDTEQMMAADFGPVAQRLARRLLDSVAEVRGGPATAWATQAELADQLGCSREWVSKLLTDFQRRGLIKLDGRRQIRVVDPLQLLGIARTSASDSRRTSVLTVR